jgi:alpha-galactosidase
LKIINARRRRGWAGGVIAALLAVVASGCAAFSLSSARLEATDFALAGGKGPVMGYDNWYLDHCRHTSEQRVLSEAKALVSTGLAAAGYRTVIVDDCWMAASRTPDGQLTWNTKAFPDGIPALAARIHAMGLKFGIYEDAGAHTCALLPGDLGHYSQDVATFKSWHVDLVKIDMCQFPKGTSFGQVVTDFTQLGRDLAAARISFDDELPVKALIDFGNTSPQYIQAVKISSRLAAMWRVAVDERTSTGLGLIQRQRELLRLGNGPAVALDDLVGTYANTVIRDFAVDLPLAPYARLGHWNDLDMMVPGNPNYGWTKAQELSQMSIWAELASPLILCTDLQKLSPALLDDLKNRSMIAIDQSGRQGREITSQGTVIAVGKPDPLGGTALLLVNISPEASALDVPLTQLGFHAASVSVTNIWTGRRWTATGRFRYPLAAESAVLLQVR